MRLWRRRWLRVCPLNESPSEKEGKCFSTSAGYKNNTPSMKVPPKRKGNAALPLYSRQGSFALNESPSEKEGKYD